MALRVSIAFFNLSFISSLALPFAKRLHDRRRLGPLRRLDDRNGTMILFHNHLNAFLDLGQRFRNAHRCHPFDHSEKSFRPADAVGRRVVALVGVGHARRNLGAGVLGSRPLRQLAGAGRGYPAGVVSAKGNAHLTTDSAGVQRGIDHEPNHDQQKQDAQPDALFHAKKLPMWRNLTYRCSTS